MPRLGGAIDMPQQNDPGTPVAGRQMLYFKSDGFLYSKNPAGTVAKIDTAPTNYVTTDSTQTGLTGDKTSNGIWKAGVFSTAGLTGATAAGRWVGCTTSGAPASGTFLTGDFVFAQNGHVWICTAGGSPGTWADAGSAGAVSSVAGRTGAVTLTAADIGAGIFPTGANIMQAATSGIALQLKAAATTPGNIQEWQTSGGSVVAKVTSAGQIFEGTNRVYSAVNNNISGTVVDNTTYGLTSTPGSSASYSAGDHSHGTTPWPRWKDPVRAASTVNVAIASALVNGLSMDGVTLATGDRVLLKNQTTSTENGIYVVVASGAASRSTDADSGTELWGSQVHVLEGTLSKATSWYLESATLPVLGTTNLFFYSKSMSVYPGQQFSTDQRGGGGWTQLTNSSTTTVSGTVDFFSNTAVRQGSIGNAGQAGTTDTGTINYIAGTHNFSGALTTQPLTSGIGLTIKAATTTPGDLQRWQTSGGSTLAKVDSSGIIDAPDYTVSGASLPRGRVASAKISSTFTAVTANTEVMVTGVAATFTFITGRRYKITAMAQFQNLAATQGTGLMRVRMASGASVTTAGTQIGSASHAFPAVATWRITFTTVIELVCVASGATTSQINAGQNTVGISAQIPTANSLVEASTGNLPIIMIEDIGV